MDEIKNQKRRRLLPAAVLVIVFIAAVLLIRWIAPQKISLKNVQRVYIEVLSRDEQSVQKIVLNEEDAKAAAAIFSGEKAWRDYGFAFAEGYTRIVFETDRKKYVLYPYCGDSMTFRLGEADGSYVNISDESELAEWDEIYNRNLSQISGGAGGIADWSHVGGAE
ncbi:MAG: hypothetical protein ACI4D3_09465 [Lachnospiraceae bacterium]